MCTSKADTDTPSIEDLRRREQALGLGAEAFKAESYRVTMSALGHEPPCPTTTAVKAVKSDPGPIKVATFDC